MLTKIKRLYEQARSRVVCFPAREVSELKEKIAKLTDEMEANDLELQTMPDLVAETVMLWDEVGKLREVSMKGEANVAALNGLHEEVLAVKKTVVELLPVAEMNREVRVDA